MPIPLRSAPEYFKSAPFCSGYFILLRFAPGILVLLRFAPDIFYPAPFCSRFCCSANLPRHWFWHQKCTFGGVALGSCWMFPARTWPEGLGLDQGVTQVQNASFGRSGADKDPFIVILVSFSIASLPGAFFPGSSRGPPGKPGFILLVLLLG